MFNKVGSCQENVKVSSVAAKEQDCFENENKLKENTNESPKLSYNIQT